MAFYYEEARHEAPDFTDSEHGKAHTHRLENFSHPHPVVGCSFVLSGSVRSSAHLRHVASYPHSSLRSCLRHHAEKPSMTRTAKAPRHPRPVSDP